MLCFLLFVLLTVAALAALEHAGRDRAQAPDRSPVINGLLRGARTLLELHDGQCRLWEAYLRELQPWRATGGPAADAATRHDPHSSRE